LRTLFIGVGVFAILFGLIGIIVEAGMVYLALSVLIGGVALIIAGLKRYRGEWPTLIGTIIVFLGIGVFNDGIDYYLAHTIKETHTIEDLSIVLSGIFISLVGSLLLCSGHKLHKYSMEIELLRNHQESTEHNEAQPTP
jgi:uncharacterized membrane protein YccC